MASIKLDHVGIAVKDVHSVVSLFSDLLRATPYKMEKVATQGVNTHFIATGEAKLELLESITPDSPIARHLEKRGEGIHHIAFEVPNINAAFSLLKQQGYEPLGDKPVPGADNKLIFFLHPKQTHGMLIEFCQQQRMPLQATRLPFEEGSLAVFELGDPSNPPLVMLHGAAGCTQMEAEPLVRRLSASYHIYALDFAAHGQSDEFSAFSFTPELFIDNVRTVFDYYNLKKAHLFGFSLGGFIGLSFAAQYPQRLHKLAVHATNLFWNEQLIDTMMKRLDHETIMRQSPELTRFLADMHGGSKWVSLFERMKDYTMRITGLQARYESVGHVTTPTLVSAVDEDDLFTVDSPVNLYKTLPNAKLAILPGKRHALQNVNLDVLTPLLQRHFS